MIDFDFINSVLAKFEGKAYTRGYIPCKGGTYYGGAEPLKGEPLGASGVTVATGVDLGQQTLEGLKKMGISAATREVLKPYIGVKRAAAVETLKERPLALTGKQVAEIDDAVHKAYIQDTEARFNIQLSVAGAKAFADAPREAQAVAVSLCYQFGVPYRDASPNLKAAWDAIRFGNYKAAADYLSFLQGWSADHQQYMARRRQEANLLLGIG